MSNIGENSVKVENSEAISETLDDDPFMRHEKSKIDIKQGSEGKRLGELRLAAMRHAGRMPLADSERPIAPTPGASNWVQTGPTATPKGQTHSPTLALVTGRVTSIIIDQTDSNIIYVGAAQGGVWKTVNGGKSWVAKTDHEISLAIGALAMDPTNHLIIYAGTGEGNFSGDSYYGNGILKTIDGGNSWTTLAASTFSMSRFCRLAVNPTTPTTIFAAVGSGSTDVGGVYRSTDGGVNWTKMTNGLIGSIGFGATDVVVDPTNTNIAYAADWSDGIYKTTDANAVVQPTWTKLTNGLPLTGSFTRVSLAISPSSPQTLYALIANNDYIIDGFYRTVNGGVSWNSIALPSALPSGQIGWGQGFYNLVVAVDPTTPDIVYLGAIFLWKAVRNPVTNTWTFTDISETIHVDNHAFAFDPTNHLIIYSGNDGGIYRSNDGGVTWIDSINKGLCITQFEFMDQYRTSDSVVVVGTQDNGTQQFRGSPVFYLSDFGDGGYVSVDPTDPSNNLVHVRAGFDILRSTEGAKFGSWRGILAGLSGNFLFYAPLALDQTNPNNVAFGGERIFLDTSQGTGGWPMPVVLSGLTNDLVSAINYVNSNLMYVGTSAGKVYRLTKSAGVWTSSKIDASPLPQRYIWDISPLPNNLNTIIVAMSGFGTAHVWRGTVPSSGGAIWNDVSGSGAGRLPDIPVNALVIEPSSPNTMYIGTDIGVFRTTDGGTIWTQFSHGLPNIAVFDMRLYEPTKLLRVVTHGRGMWERKLGVSSMPDVNIYVRDHIMDSGRISPSSSTIRAVFEDELHSISLGQELNRLMCADIKIDALEGSSDLSFQIPNVDEVDYVIFESKLKNHIPQRGRINRVYVQVHNRGIQAASSITVKLLYADASAQLPQLPPDFWTSFPADSTDTTNWKPIGSPKIITSLSVTEPVVLEFDWSISTTAADNLCILMIIDSPSDPIPSANKVFDVETLGANEKHVGLKKVMLSSLVENLAITAIAASGSDSPTPPGNAIDNNLSTRWSNNAIGSWIRADLGVQKTVSSVDIAWYNGNERQNNFVISVSNDGTTFTNVFTGKSSGTTSSSEKYDFPDVTARYVKITVNGNTQNNWASITEIDVYGSSSILPVVNLPITAVVANGDDGNHPANAIDNNLNTRWSNLGIGSWIRADLGVQKTVSSVDIAWYNGNQRQSNFVISVSNDGTTFTNVFTGKSSGTTSSSEKYDFPDVTARYVKITVNGNTQNNWASITEIDVYGP